MYISDTFVQPTRLSVLLTDPSVTNDLYPLAARGVLGYGVNAPTTAPANASLIPSFLPCVDIYVYVILT